MRYDIKKVEGQDGQVTLLVGYSGQPDRERVGVWVCSDGRARCIECQTMLTAMSASCKHARAAERYLKREQQ